MTFKKQTKRIREYINRRNNKINNVAAKFSYGPRKTSIAGKPIAQGGFGCVFKPALNCKKSITDKNYVSKLMLKKYVDEEMHIINIVKKNLIRIPYYGDYFLVKGTYACPILPLSKKDKIGFNEKCSSLYKRNITYKNVNTKLSKLRVINLPYGGIDMDDILE